LLLVVLVVAEELGADPVAVEQRARPARVLAGYEVRLAQRRQHAQRHVLEVADRGRADHQAPTHAAASSASRAAPIIPASLPKWASTTFTISRFGGRPRSASTSRAGSSIRSPAAEAPPPMITSSGLKMFTSDTMPMPSQRPASAIT